MLASLALACALAVAPSARGLQAVSEADPTSLLDVGGQWWPWSKRPAPPSTQSLVPAADMDGPAPPSGGLQLVFVTDCTYHQRWMAMTLLHSAGRVGQTEPITWLRWNCPQEELAESSAYELFLQKVYPHARLIDVAKNTPISLKDISWIKPLAFREYLSDARITNDTVVAMLEGDFTFMSKFRVDNLDQRNISSMQGQPRRGRVEGMHGVVQRYECCNFSGVPYVFTVEAWRALLPEYTRLHDEARGTPCYPEEQVALSRAVAVAGVTFESFDHFMVSASNVEHEAWPWVTDNIRAGGDTCSARVGRDTDEAPLPTFMHVVRDINPEGQESSWQYNKFQIPPGWKHQEGDGILACDMPLLAEPPTDYVQTNAQRGVEAQREAWMLCEVIHSINDMLLDVKPLKCPKGFNQAKAMKVQKNWKNILLEGPTIEAPWRGTNHSFVQQCVQDLACGEDKSHDHSWYPVPPRAKIGNCSGGYC